MLKFLVVGLGGFVGAIARYGLSGLVHRWYAGSFPWGTLTVNLLGCLLIGALMTLVEVRQFFSPNMRAFLIVGMLGSLTTFSTFGRETLVLMQENAWLSAGANMAGNLVLGLAAVWLGRALVLWIGV